ncbi:hypothetical protein N7468_006112 [Penicillium chermesinum]|uniref:Uncharacterized protein n=1 Tax=Penicillium chermesinum TaxID=63820 RepID=A0A9W9P0U4_9EURO|nr:uncharacterized protein N7468_006112 [Penicillium chermesinum]KAJ5233156.1 hypothetical protein N7468_006112 [Penicillium chermesinum]
MSQPSWLEPTNNLEQISGPTSPIFRPQAPSLDLHKVRCLWLLSFVQDMRTFMASFSTKELPPFTFFHAAITLLRHEFQLSTEISRSESHVTQQETELLICLFSMSILVQESLSAFADANFIPLIHRTALGELEEILRRSHRMWHTSAQQLRFILCESFDRLHQEGQRKMHYAMNLVQVLSTLSLEARQGVEKCLLNLLYQLGNKDRTPLLIDDRWSPDSLLSSIHGY